MTGKLLAKMHKFMPCYAIIGWNQSIMVKKRGEEIQTRLNEQAEADGERGIRFMARRASKTGQTRIRRNLEAIMPLTRQIFSLVKYYVICVAVVLLLSNFVAKPS